MNQLDDRQVDNISLYLHIPFCKLRCTYCAFNIYTGLESVIPAYVAQLAHEIEDASQRASRLLPCAHTLYFGGGTPSLLEPQQVSNLIDCARRGFRLQENAEITLEINPGTVDDRRLSEFHGVGVNRISVGVQSAHGAELTLFGRDHTFAQAAEAFDLARRAGFENISIDLIYGAPFQTRAGWQETLDSVLAWEPAHVSLYSLSLEPGTRLAWLVGQHQLPLPDPDLAADMYDDACERLDRTSLRHYEISNWAVPGFECRHNRQYWINKPFYGFGAGAHGFVEGMRYWNVKSIRAYMACAAENRANAPPLPLAVDSFDVIDEPMARFETLMLNLRLIKEGVRLTEFAERFGLSPDEAFETEIARLESMGLLERTPDRLRLARQAYLISNQVFVRLMPDA
jgi:oxygen-independent coproporphyrinogen-3 oxidase